MSDTNQNKPQQGDSVTPYVYTPKGKDSQEVTYQYSAVEDKKHQTQQYTYTKTTVNLGDKSYTHERGAATQSELGDALNDFAITLKDAVEKSVSTGIRQAGKSVGRGINTASDNLAGGLNIPEWGNSAKKVSALAGGISMAIVASIMGMIAIAGWFSINSTFDVGMSIIMTLLTAGFGFGSWKCFNISKCIDLARRYRSILKGWAGCTLAELAAATQRTKDSVRKELLKLIQGGYMPGARLDTNNDVLFASEDAYRTYQKQHAQKRAEAEEKEKINKSRGFAQDAQAFLAQTAELKKEIENPQVLEQVEHMEKVVGDIAAWLAEHPGSEGKVRRLSNYYLPTALKLLRTYVTVDDNPGATAKNICQNITGILYTFNTALLNMQDSLLEDTAMDVSAEISAMKSVLQQEGLAGDDLSAYLQADEE